MIASLVWRRWFREWVQPSSSPELKAALAEHQEPLPVLWLLGKTGSGKSSIIQRLTGNTSAQIGNGFEPCTQSSMRYDHPVDSPVIRFLDTRGLGEAHYDPSADLEAANAGSHALIILTRIDDTDQSDIVRALNFLDKRLDSQAIVHVHTHIRKLDDQQRTRATVFNANTISKALEFTPVSAEIDFTSMDDGYDDMDYGLENLRLALVDIVPQLAKTLSSQISLNSEESLFQAHRREILGYASVAGTADVLPAVGLFAVPSIQGKLLHTLAGRYEIPWDKRTALEFTAAMGSGFLYRYALSLGGRQLSKLIPLYGQSAGAAAAAAMSFASTYAIGRAACLYFYRKHNQLSIDTESLQRTFTQALKERKKK